ncbi:glycosyltransferase [Allopusillimonas ginsengisoli]|uniref:glycosyltransferase n=1 Tax=Allopusillimonas ginsengisoli TaxID=453575 RepID=UPI001431CD90|nr:glycosyltransferase [Allopusillimonas ginsengisoli]
MKIAIVAPSPTPFVIGGAENLWWGMLRELNSRLDVEADLIKIPSPEHNLLSILGSYRMFATLDLDHFDMVISTKYPAWMVRHRNHMVYLQHTLRGLYDSYPSNQRTHLDPAILDTLRLPSAVSDALLDAGPTSLEAVEVIDALLAARERCDNWDSVAALPGPFSRAVVHLLDRIGMRPGRIQRYAAIAREVADRKDYFPPGCAVEIFHHPTHLLDDALVLPAQEQEGAPAIFTASRLVREKRIDLIIDAYRMSGVHVPLRIAGSGAQEQDLRRQAEGLEGVQFLGRLTDEQVRQEYRAAAFVPFVPLREDYGLITVEAMGFGKPVLTALDSGGPTEVVEDGVTGLVVSPTVDSVALAMRQLLEDEPARLRMGNAARAHAAQLSWEAFGDWLLVHSELARTPCASSETLSSYRPLARRPSRPRLLVINTFSVHRPVSGGQLRMMGLYSELAKSFDVHFANLCKSVTVPATRRLAENLWEHVAPISADFHHRLGEVESALGVSTVDLVAAQSPELLPQWLDIIQREASLSDLIVCSHPYGHPALKRAAPGRRYLYDAHNVEFDLKRGMYGEHAGAVEAIRAVEGECARGAAGVIACSAQDAQRLAALYGLDQEKPVQVVPNGVDLAEADGAGAQCRLALSARFGKRRPMALFMGSAHLPNIEAFLTVVEAAPRLPDFDFVVMGSVCSVGSGREPDNVKLLGVVSAEEKTLWLGLADVGLNPVTSGSGTNLKTLEYVARGVLMVSTPAGVRGTEMAADAEYLAIDEGAPVEGLVSALQRYEQMTLRDRAGMIRGAYDKVAQTADWEMIGRRYAAFSRGFLRT